MYVVSVAQYMDLSISSSALAFCRFPAVSIFLSMLLNQVGM